MVGYGLGNSAGPQYWKKQYQPRNHIPWAILSACWFVSAVLLLITRAYLARENANREKEAHDDAYDEVYVSENGEKLRVDRAFLDLTDEQNRDFRYDL